jgi:hypothetical protein
MERKPKNLVIFLKDGSHKVFYVNPKDSQDRHFKVIEKSLGFDGLSLEDIIKHIYVDDEKMPPMGFHAELKWKNSELVVDRAGAIESKMIMIRRIRNAMLESLDLPYQIAVETEDEKAVERLKKRKKFLRELPDKIDFGLIGSTDDIISYNPFYNVFSVVVYEAGTGYKKPPTVKIEPPTGNFYGTRATGQAVLESGTLKSVKLTNMGSAYMKTPEIKISAPETKRGVQARAFVEIDNIIDFDV